MSVQAGLQLAAHLTAQGVPATANPRDVHPPCVLVEPPSRTYTGVPEGYLATWRLRALANPPADLDAWTALDALVEAATAALALVDVFLETVEPAAYLADPAAVPLPCLTMTATTAVTP